MKKKSRIVAVLMAALLVTAMPLSVLADEWNLANGDITVEAGGSYQNVYQGGNKKEDFSPVITSKGAETTNTITIHSQDDATATVTIKDVNISPPNSSAISVSDNSKAEITVSGDNNTLTSTASASSTEAIVHVGDNAELTIKGSGTGDSMNITAGEGRLAPAIGSHYGKDFTGTVNIENLNLTVDNGTGNTSAIGSGPKTYAGGGDFSGAVNIADSSVQITNSAGAGIGSGYRGSFSGEVNITDSEMDISSRDASIGSGCYGAFTENAEIMIDNSTVKADCDDRWYAAAIGAGYGYEMQGKISITGTSEILTDDCIARDDDYGTVNGTVLIGSNAKLYSKDGKTQREWADAIKGAQMQTIVEDVPSSASAEPTVQVVSSTSNAKTFWNNVIAQIRAAKKGDTITIDAGGFTTMPRAVMEALAECGVTLVIRWMGGEITIDNPVVDDSVWVYSFYTLFAG